VAKKSFQWAEKYDCLASTGLVQHPCFVFSTKRHRFTTPSKQKCWSLWCQQKEVLTTTNIESLLGTAGSVRKTFQHIKGNMETLLAFPPDVVLRFIERYSMTNSGDSRLKKWGGQCGAKEKVGGPT